MPVAGREGQGTVPDARRGHRQRRPAGNRNALKHGRYTRELLEFKRSVRELLRESAAKLELV